LIEDPDYLTAVGAAVGVADYAVNSSPSHNTVSGQFDGAIDRGAIPHDRGDILR